MKIYGVALLAGCFLVGQIMGKILGHVMGIDGNVGGVAFGMILLILLNRKLNQSGSLDTTSQSGITFWSMMYIPIVVAMSSIQNVKAALTGGWTALFVGIIATGVSFLMVPFISKLGSKKS